MAIKLLIFFIGLLAGGIIGRAGSVGAEERFRARADSVINSIPECMTFTDTLNYHPMVKIVRRDEKCWAMTFMRVNCPDRQGRQKW